MSYFLNFYQIIRYGKDVNSSHKRTSRYSKPFLKPRLIFKIEKKTCPPVQIAMTSRFHVWNVLKSDISRPWICFLFKTSITVMNCPFLIYFSCTNSRQMLQKVTKVKYIKNALRYLSTLNQNSTLLNKFFLYYFVCFSLFEIIFNLF